MAVNTVSSRVTLRSLQLFIAILAFATTSKFNTTITLTLKCTPTSLRTGFEHKINYVVKYPFRFTDQIFEVYQNCSSNHKISQSFDMNYSSIARFYVSIGEFSMFYAIVFLIIYIFGSNYYANNSILALLDFMSTGIIAVFWFCGTFSWSQTLTDLKYFTNSETMMSLIDFCNNENIGNSFCYCENPVNWTNINVSLFLGYFSVLFWVISMWFIYKNTPFYPKLNNDNNDQQNNESNNLKQQILTHGVHNFSEKQPVYRY